MRIYNENVPSQPIFFARRKKKGKREEIDCVWPVNESSLSPSFFFLSFFLFFILLYYH